MAGAITSSPTTHYGILRQFGSPVPGVKGAGGSTTYTEQVLNIKFNSDTSSDYDDDSFVIHRVPTTPGTTSTAFTFGLNQASSYGGTAVSTGGEINISDADLDTAEDIIDTIVAHIAAMGTLDFTVARSGDSLVITNTRGGTCSASSVSDSTRMTLTTTTAGSTVAASGANPRLLSDTWIGLADSITVPTTSVEMKQLNLASAGTRNYVYQFKGAESTDGGSINLFANNFSFLYYALGKKVIGAVTTEPGVTMDTSPATDAFFLTTGLTGTNFIFDDTSSDTTDRFYRVEGNTVCPPIRKGVDDGTGIKKVGTAATDLITYTYSEENGEELPSFALEYTLKKGSQNATIAVDAAKEAVYTKIYPGCQVNTMTITADEGQEIKLDVSLMSKTTIVAPTNYETFNNETNVQNFVNYGSRVGGTSSVDAGLMTPYFFSGGTIEMFGNEYIRIQNCTLTINNGLQDKRFIGRTNKRIKSMVTGQRTYELQFTGLVTDSAIFDELRNDTSTALSGTSSLLKLNFFKDNNEKLELHFKDYMVKSADFPLTNDNSPITVTWTIEPLVLEKAEETTYWVIQG